MQPQAAYPAQRITYRYPTRWSPPPWRASAWDYAAKACSSCPIILQSSGRRNSCGDILVKILVTTKKDFEKNNRRRFCSRIATGDYDAIIIGHSQFEKIPMSKERQERLLQEQIQEITDGIQELKFMRGEQFTIKQMERTRKQLEGRLRKLQAEGSGRMTSSPLRSWVWIGFLWTKRTGTRICFSPQKCAM